MATFKLVKSETRPLTPELIRQFHAMTASPTERDLDAGRVRFLVEQFTAGYAVTFQWALARIPDHPDYRMNGQHSSAALLEMLEKGALPAGLMVNLSEYECDDLQGMALLFRQFDQRKSSRTALDISGVYQNLHADLQGINRKVGKLCIEGVIWYRKAIEHIAVPAGDESFLLFNEQALHPFYRWAGDIFGVKTKELKHPAIIGAMYYTWSENPQQAGEFWHEIARGGAEFEDNAPTRVLDEWLQGLVDEDRDRSEKIKPGDRYNGCLYAWHAHREDRTITTIRYQPKKAPGRRSSQPARVAA
jgi:hypothetical protein